MGAARHGPGLLGLDDPAVGAARAQEVGAVSEFAYTTTTGTLCGATHHSGKSCQREHGHEGAHMNFTNGTLAWGFPLTRFRA